MLHDEKGFTLIELMVVVLIIGILVAIAIPVFSSASDNAKLKSCKANLRTLDGAIETYRAELGGAPAAVSNLVSGGYVKVSPTCPHSSAADYTITSNAAVCTSGHTYP